MSEQLDTALNAVYQKGYVKGRRDAFDEAPVTIRVVYFIFGVLAAPFIIALMLAALSWWLP